MVVALGVAGIIFVLYGLAMVVPGSHSTFFLMWLALGSVLLALAWALYTGVWVALPAAVRVTFCICCAVVATLIVSALIPVVRTMGEDAPAGLDVLICLGAWVRPDGSPSKALSYRLEAAADYLEENPKTRCVLSGGRGPNEPVSEAQAMRDYLTHRGIAPARLVLEDRSSSTHENLAFSRELIEAGATVGIVTNGFHLYRAGLLARAQGLGDVALISAPSRAFYLPHNVVRECLCLIKDRLVGHL